MLLLPWSALIHIAFIRLQGIKMARVFSPINIFRFQFTGWISRWEDKIKTNVERLRLRTFFSSSSSSSSLPCVCKGIFPGNIVPGDENSFCWHLICLTLVNLDNLSMLHHFRQKLTWCLLCPSPITRTLLSLVLWRTELNVVFKCVRE